MVLLLALSFGNLLSSEQPTDGVLPLLFALCTWVFVGCNTCCDEVCCPTGCCCFKQTGIATGDAQVRGFPWGCAAMVEMVSTVLCCWGWDLRLGCSCLGSTRQVCLVLPCRFVPWGFIPFCAGCLKP